MVTAATKKYRDIFAYGLLAVAALYLISGLSLLFKSKEDIGLGFTGKAAVFGYLFAHPVLVFSLIAAVSLSVGFGEASKNARTVVLIAMGVAGLSLLLGLICWFSGFAADGADVGRGGLFGGVFGAGKIVGIFLGLAQLLLLGLAAWFAYTVLQALPKAVRPTAAWGQQQAYGAQQGYPQPTWGQPGPGYSPQPGWGQPGAGWGTGDPAGGAWADQSQAQAGQQGQPASAWPGSEPGYAPPAEQQPQSSRGQPGQAGEPDQSAQWGPPEPTPQPQQSSESAAQPPAAAWVPLEGASWDPSAAPAPEPEQPAETQQWDAGSVEPTDQESQPDDEHQPPPGGSWQPPSS